jgi:hypothetical protein
MRLKPNLLLQDPSSIPGEVTPKDAQIWRNLNAFTARCLGAGVLGPYLQVMDALRLALEEEISASESRVQIACEWIYHSAKPLLLWAQENIDYTDVPAEDEAAFVEAGPLYHGPSPMCLQRWTFWLSRLEQFAKESSGLSEETLKTVLTAAGVMRAAETVAGRMWFGGVQVLGGSTQSVR